MKNSFFVVKAWRAVTLDHSQELLEAKLVAAEKIGNNLKRDLRSLHVQEKECSANIEYAENIADQKRSALLEAKNLQEREALEDLILQEQREENDLLFYEQQLEGQYDSLIFDTQNCPDFVRGDRQNALAETIEQGCMQYDQEYSLSPQAEAFLQKHAVGCLQVHNFYGTTLQQQLHREYCNIIEQAAAKQAELPYESGLLKQIISCTDAAYDANQLGQIKTVLALNNLSFALLEYSQAAVRAVEYGFLDALHMALHPIETCKDIGKAVAYLLETTALNSSEMVLEYPEIYEPMRDERNAEIVAGLKALGERMENSTGPERFEALVRFGTNCYVSGKIIKVVGEICGAVESTTVKGLNLVETEIDASKSVQDVVKVAQEVEAIAQENIVQSVAKELKDAEAQVFKTTETFSGQGNPTPPRTAEDLKASALRKAERLAVKVEKLPDGRIRYYEEISLSKTPGPTKGSSHVVEFDPKTGRVRGWMECYDHAGNVNRVRPKYINGRDVVSQHYPATYKDIQNNIKGSKWNIPKKNLD